MSCLDALPACANVRDGVGPGLNNNDRTLTWIDRDADPATFDSSSADLALPPGAKVLFAGLYYGGKLSAGSGGSPAPNPGAAQHRPVQGPRRRGVSDGDGVAGRRCRRRSTRGSSNVTAIVDAAGAGTYWTANVQLGTGLNAAQSGGWALVVAYGDPDAPSRNLSVFDGMQTVSQQSGHDPAERLPDAALGPGDLDGRDRRLPGGSRDRRRLAQDPGWVRGLHRAVECRQPGTTGDLGVELERLQRDDLQRRRVGHLADAELRNNLGYDADLFRTTNCSATGRRARRCGSRPAATPTSRVW